MKTDSVMWLLLVVFMLHDFEEIILLPVWLQRNAAGLMGRVPAIARKAFASEERLSSSSFALAVAEEFFLAALVTVICVERGLYAVWTGVLIVFFFHTLVHIGQWLFVGRYIPAIVTSVLSLVYSGYALWVMFARVGLAWQQVILPTLISLIVVAVNLRLSSKLAARFEKWLAGYAGALQV